MDQLFDYQEQSIDTLREALAFGEKPVLSSPTGSGKTRIAGEVFSLALRKGKRVAFCVPFLSLIDQTWQSFVKIGICQGDISIIQADNPLYDPNCPIQICSVDTLVRRGQLPSVDLVLFDECHRQSKLYQKWMESDEKAKFIGLSATPWARGMNKIWTRMIVVATTAELIESGHLSPYKYFAPASPDLSKVRVTAGGDYHEGDLSTAMNKPKLIADIVTTWMRLGENRPTFAFCVDCAHARQLKEHFEQAGVACGYIDAYTEVAERQLQIDQLRDGKLKVITSVGTLTTGVDAPFVSCIILARPTKSEMLYVQIVGRGLRKAPGKSDCIVLDHSDTATDLGLPDEIAYDDFIEKRPRKAREGEKRKPKKCPQCSYLKPAGHHGACPYCGFLAKAPVSKIECVDGELVALTKNGKAKATRDEKQAAWSGLLWMAAERSYSRGWASHKYKELFDVWPKGLNDIHAMPDQWLRNWVRAGQRAYAKSMGAKRV